MGIVGLPIPDAFKKPIGSYLREAQALEKHDPLMAYFCRFYAMQQAIPLMSQAPSAGPYLETLMNQLEQEKVTLEANGFDLADSKHATSFALRTFAVADKQDRAGQATKSTARTFMAASAFFDVLQQFKALPEDLVEMRKYCKFKAAQILKAIREGRQPEVGGPMSVEERELNALMAMDDEPSSSAPSATTNTSTTTTTTKQTTTIDDPFPSMPEESNDDDLAALNLLGSLPSVPPISSNTNTATTTTTDTNVTPPSDPPPAYDVPSAAVPSSTNAASDINAALEAMKQQYDLQVRQQKEEMLRLHKEQENQIAELRTLAQRQANALAAEGAKSNVSSNTAASSATTTMPVSTSFGGGSERALLPLDQVDTALGEKYARFIASSFQYDDLPTALKNLKIVGRILTGGGSIQLDVEVPGKKY